jgi:4-hydroxy-tetrahydrodipicolinate reductase
LSAVTAIALHGAAGRMGRAIIRAAASSDQIRIAAAIDHPSCKAIGSDVGRLAGAGEMGVTVSDDLGAALAEVKVILDLSHPDATAGVAAAAETAGVALICGTTGLTDEALAALDRAAGQVPLLVAANLSPGIAVMAALLERAAGALGQGYDIEIAELHHRDKIDAPSGTALMLARAAAAARGLDDTALTHGRQGRTGARRADEIGVLALRGGGVFGEHTAILAGEHERLEITHRAASRELFAAGALRAARFLDGKPPGRYSMKDVLGLQAG